MSARSDLVRKKLATFLSSALTGVPFEKSWTVWFALLVLSAASSQRSCPLSCHQLQLVCRLRGAERYSSAILVRTGWLGVKHHLLRPSRLSQRPGHEEVGPFLVISSDWCASWEELSGKVRPSWDSQRPRHKEVGHFLVISSDWCASWAELNGKVRPSWQDADHQKSPSLLRNVDVCVARAVYNRPPLYRHTHI